MLKIFASIVHQPTSWDVGPLQLTGFGLAVLLAFVISQIMTQRELARRGHDPEPIGDIVFAAVIGGLLGGKLYYAILMHDLGAVFSRAGFWFWGGLLAELAPLTWSSGGAFKLPQISDVAAPARRGYSIG
jgi:phosphatidylglycerol:prolipoprotein diacylglycerol transferase